MLEENWWHNKYGFILLTNASSAIYAHKNKKSILGPFLVGFAGAIYFEKPMVLGEQPNIIKR